MWPRLLLAVLSLVVLGAHFLRSGGLIALLIILGLIALLFVRRPWSVRVVRIALVMGAIEWILTLTTLAGQRMQMGEPAGRMTLILGGVALVTGLSAFLLRGDKVREYYRMDPAVDEAEPDVQP